MSDPSTFRERLAWDAASGATLDQTRRSMMIRPDALTGAFRRLDPGARGAALEALGWSVFEHGSDSARAYRAMGGEGATLASIVAGFDPSQTPVCRAIAGMVRGVATLVFERPAVAREIACAATGAPVCTFEAHPA